MAARRSVVRLATRCSTSAAFRQSSLLLRRVPTSSLRAIALPSSSFLRHDQSRCYSTPATSGRVVDFAEVKSLVDSPKEDTVLVDVREPHEYAEGFIPTAINVPIASQPDAIFLAPEEFEDRFGFQKPAQNKELVFYCKAGVRSSAAAQLALQHGYTRVGEYRGSWLDWEKNGGVTSKDAKGTDGPDSPM